MSESLKNAQIMTITLSHLEQVEHQDRYERYEYIHQAMAWRAYGCPLCLIAMPQFARLHI